MRKRIGLPAAGLDSIRIQQRFADKMQRIQKQEYTAEFKLLAVKRKIDGLTAGAAARELGLIEQTLRNGVKAAAAGTLKGAGAKLVTPEQMKLSRVRAENLRLIRENEILIPRGH